MSTKELNRLEIIQKLGEKRMRQKEAAHILGLSVRQVKRLLKSYRGDGAQGLVSKRRGRPSNNRLLETTRQKVLDLQKSKALNGNQGAMRIASKEGSKAFPRRRTL